MTPEFVRSPDGTAIAVHRRGAGRTVVLVHGSASDHHAWDAVIERLHDRFELWLMDRRGHGASERGPEPHSVYREGEDVAAVLAHAGPDAGVLAHSWGARCALAGLASGARAAGAVLYEPLDTERVHFGAAELDVLERLEADGAPDAVLEEFFGTFAQVPRAAIGRLAGTQEWAMALDAIGTLTRESRAWAREPLELEPLRAVLMPIRLLLGSESLDGYVRTARRLAEVLPEAEVHRLPGQGHTALSRAPDLVARAFVSFEAALNATFR
ncbi:MAG TPA: alpha/beta fold hydrolase [Solirubrobacteraceae bacterium]|nr:alpha/beta fold hydrolase [Solirubrobacteraceae bacterium]